MPMKLFFSPLSPFARKCRVVAIEKGLEDRIDMVSTLPMDNFPELLAANPLARVPALVTEDGLMLCESPVICEYLDSLSAGNPLYPSHEGRFEALGLAALCDGIMDSAVACVVESRRPEALQSPEWTIRKENAVRRALSVVAAHPQGDRLHIGSINLVCALAYVSFRLPHLNWRNEYRPLAAWFDALSRRPSFAATAPQ